MTFLQELQEKLGNHDPEEVDQLILDDLFQNVRVITDEMKSGLEKYKDLKHLSLNNIGLSCLKNLPDIPTLEILEIRENYITGKDFNLIVKAYPKLLKLKLGGNPIKSLDVFEALSKSDIMSIELFNTSIFNIKGYKELLFHKVKSLEAIDSVGREGYQVESDFMYEDDDSFDEEEEDCEYEENSKEAEDEFDEDFDDEEESFELSEYNSVDNGDVIKSANNNNNNNTNGGNLSSKKKMKIHSNKKEKSGKKKNNYHSDDNDVSITSSVDPNKHKNKKNKKQNINNDLLNGLLGVGLNNNDINNNKNLVKPSNLSNFKDEENEIQKADDENEEDKEEMIMIKKLEKKEKEKEIKKEFPDKFELDEEKDLEEIKLEENQKKDA